MIIDDERLKIKGADTKPEKKTKEPPKYQVVMVQKKQGAFIQCAACVLVEIFKKSTEAATMHAKNASDRGKESVFTGLHDVVETKAADANAAKKGRNFICALKLRHVEFTTEPAP